MSKKATVIAVVNQKGGTVERQPPAKIWELDLQ